MNQLGRIGPLGRDSRWRAPCTRRTTLPANFGAHNTAFDPDCLSRTLFLIFSSITIRDEAYFECKPMAPLKELALTYTTRHQTPPLDVRSPSSRRGPRFRKGRRFQKKSLLNSLRKWCVKTGLWRMVGDRGLEWLVRAVGLGSGGPDLGFAFLRCQDLDPG